MSYGFDLWNIGDLAADLEAIDEKDTIKITDWSPLLDLQKQLQAFDPKLEASQDDHSLQLIHPNYGITIYLFADEAGMSIPYLSRNYHEIFALAFEYLRIIQDATGYQIYDPQIGEIIRLDNIPKSVYEVYASI